MAAQLLWGMLFSSIGVGYFIYGKKQGSLIPLICGIALMAYVYFISNVYLLVAVGVVISAVPYFLRD
ncbi:MAG: hypothetical protein KGL36_07615 [Gammaproteobacteria bacterium]|nr:hypothetical protein [Gammaproteobacteria bacterium]